jgi:hypothetical protein
MRLSWMIMPAGGTAAGLRIVLRSPRSVNGLLPRRALSPMRCWIMFSVDEAPPDEVVEVWLPPE